MKEDESKNGKVNPNRNKPERLIAHTLKSLIDNPGMSDEQAEEILQDIRTLVRIIVDIQFEQEIRVNEYKEAA